MSAKRNRHHKKTPTTQMDIFKQKLMRENQLSEEKLLINTTKPKLSQALTSFIEPFADAAETNEEYEKLLTIAIIAWNATLMDDDEAQTALIEKTVSLHEDQETTRAILNTFMERKKLFFADDKRTVANFKLTHFKDGRRHLAVAARVPKGENDH